VGLPQMKMQLCSLLPCPLLLCVCNLPMQEAQADQLLKLLSCTQARAFYGFQIAIENIHSGATENRTSCRRQHPCHRAEQVLGVQL
jgi:hypothetical protein